MLTTGILISGNTSVGVRKMTIGPRIRISRASTVKVYGRRRANLTIHMMLSSYELTAKPRGQGPVNSPNYPTVVRRFRHYPEGTPQRHCQSAMMTCDTLFDDV